MKRKHITPGLNSLRLNQPVGFCLLVLLALAIWPGRVMLASALQSGPVDGEIRLQGRSDHSGVEVRIQSPSESGEFSAFSVAPALVTDADGAVNLQGQGELVITAHKPGYLDAQAKVTVSPDEPLDLGPTTLYGGEVTGDNSIDIADLAYLGASFDTSDARGDLNSDGKVDVLDLSMAAGNFRMSGPTPWGE